MDYVEPDITQHILDGEEDFLWISQNGLECKNMIKIFHIIFILFLVKDFPKTLPDNAWQTDRYIYPNRGISGLKQLTPQQIGWHFTPHALSM